MRRQPRRILRYPPTCDTPDVDRHSGDHTTQPTLFGLGAKPSLCGDCPAVPYNPVRVRRSAAIYGSFEEIGFDPAFPRSDNLGDFGSFYESGRAALRGTNPYDIYPLTFFAAAGATGAAVNLNAPFSAVLFEILPTWSPSVAARIFNIAAVLAYLGAMFAAALAIGPNGAATNRALTGLAARLGIGGISLPVSGALVVGVAIWIYRKKPSAIQSSAAALVATLLSSPLAWTGYAVLLLPVFFSRPWNVATMCAAGLLLIPVGSVLLRVAATSQPALVIVGSTYTWAWLLLLASTCVSRRHCSVKAA